MRLIALAIAAMPAVAAWGAPAEFPLTWVQESGMRVTSQAGMDALAPDVVRLDDGDYRMFFTVTAQGIGSAISEDGLRWAREPRLRLQSQRVVGREDFDVGHPWLLRLPDRRWRMYFQSNTGRETPMRIKSAISRTDDPCDFEIEGTRIDIGPSTGLAFAGHGRALVRTDGLHLLLFSGNRLGEDPHLPSDIMLATSRDGLGWDIVNRALFENGHDPALVAFAPGQIACAYGELAVGFDVATSSDGLTWSAPQRLTLLNLYGRGQSSMTGDLCLFRFDDGTLRMYGNSREGIISLVPGEQDPDWRR